MLKLEDFKAAKKRVDEVILPTHLIHSDAFSEECGNDVYIKTENLSKFEQEMRNKEKDAEERINSSKENADKEFTATAASLTIQIVRQTVMENLTPAAQDKLIDTTIKAVGSLNS